MRPRRMLKVVCFAFLWLSGVGVAGAPALQLGPPRPVKEQIERLERPERTANLRIEEILSRVKPKPGDVIADIGAGTGTFARPLARAVAPGGKLLAVEINQELLDYIDDRSKEEKIDNIQTVFGEFDDPKLPTRQVDLAFIHSVLHHIEHRAVYLKNLATYMKPTGRIVIIDADQEQPEATHADNPELQVHKDQLMQWMSDAEFFPVEQYPDLLDRKFFFIFARH